VRALGGARAFAHPLSDSLNSGFSCALSKTGTRIVAGGAKRVEILDLRTGSKLAPKAMATQAAASRFFSPSGRYLSERAVPTRRLRLWDLDRGALVLDVPSTGMFEQSVAYSPDEQMIAYVSDADVHVATLPDGREILRFQHIESWLAPAWNPHELRFTADGSCILSVGWQVKRWMLPPGIVPKAL
jgi:WD40 repeat protein